MLNIIKKKTVLLSVLGSLGGTYSIGYLSSLVAGNFYTNSILSFCVFSALIPLLFYTWNDILQLPEPKQKRRRFWFAFLTALFFAVTLVFGYQLKAAGMTESGVRGKGLIVIRAFLLAFSIFPFSNLLFKWSETIKTAQSAAPSKNNHALRIFFIIWAVIFLCWIPVFLAYYPAVMGFDFHRQSQEAMRGFAWFNNYQPLAHTLLIWVAFQIGTAAGSLQFGMACYSIFQMAVLSVAFAYSSSIVYRLITKKWPVVVLTAFYALFPYNSILSVGVTKDVIFSALFLIFVCVFVEKVFLTSDSKKERILNILWVIEGIFMMLYRNNALYAVAVFMIIYLFSAPKKQRLGIIIMALCLVLGGKGALEFLDFALGTVGRGSQVEMFSVPIQQFARVGYYHGDTLDSDTYELLDTYVPSDYWRNYYAPIADSVKAYIGQFTFNDTWKGHYPEMLGAWLKIGLKFPNEYIDAFLLLSSGYWFIDDVSFADVLEYGADTRMGALPCYNSTVSDVIPEGIAHESKFPALEEALVELVCGNSFYNMPVISVLFKPAFYCWSLLLTAILCIYNRYGKKLLATSLPLIYLATMFLGPVVQVRYVFPIMITVPVMLALFVSNQCKNK